MFSVTKRLATHPQTDLPGGVWQAATPQSLATFSAVGWFFGQAVQQNIKKPIGLVNASWGGTRIEPWTSLQGLEKWDRFCEVAQLHAEKLNLKQPVITEAATQNEEVHIDESATGLFERYEKADYDDKKWPSMTLPGYWTDKGYNFVGAMWYRKEITIPKSWLENELYLKLGAFVDFDNTYLNGSQVGATGKETPSYWAVPRKYIIPVEKVKAGRNVIAIRIFAHKTTGCRQSLP